MFSIGHNLPAFIFMIYDGITHQIFEINCFLMMCYSAYHINIGKKEEQGCYQGLPHDSGGGGSDDSSGGVKCQ